MKFNDFLDDYILNKIDEMVLYKNLEQYFYKLLKEYKFRELEYLKIYPFISELQDMDLYKDHSLKEKIKIIRSVLNGDKNYSYDLWIGLEKKNMNKISKIYNDFQEKGTISYEKIEILKINLKKLKIKTVEDLCWEKLLEMLIRLPTVNGDAGSFNILYFGEIDKTSLSLEIEKLIDVLSGKRPIHLLLKYSNSFLSYNIL